MNTVKLRQLIILLHLSIAAFLAPAFLLVAVSGGLYLVGQKGAQTSTQLTLPAGSTLDFKSANLEDDVRALLEWANIDEEFEYIKNRGSLIQTRPTSQTYVEFKQGAEGLSATRHKPNLQKSMIELHKGHGPLKFKTYQKLVALGLLGVVLGGFVVGLLAANYRRKTLIASALGFVAFFILAL